MFGKKEPDMEVIIGHKSGVKGEISSSGTVRVDGSFEGNIVAESLIIGESGCVIGDITVKSGIIGGKMTGNIRANDCVEVRHSGVVYGIGYYREYKDSMVKLLQGDHKVILINGNGQREEKTIKISNVKVIPQPFGSLFNLMLNDVGELGEKRYVHEKTGVIDIGFKTSDFTVSDRMRYSERGSRTTDTGISKAFTIIADKLREKSNVSVELYRLHEAVDQGVIKIRGKEFDLKGITDQVFGHLATAIASEADRLWSDDWDIDTIVLTGGGGAVLAKYLQPLISGKLVVVDPAKDARLCNVQGYWKFGKHLWARGSIQPPVQQTPEAPKP